MKTQIVNKTMQSWIPVVTLATMTGLAGPTLAQGAKIEQAADKSVSVVTPVYTARIDPAGNLTELNVKGTPFATHTFLKPPDAKSNLYTPFENVTVNVINQLVAVRSGDARTEWTFGEDVVSVETEGFSDGMQQINRDLDDLIGTQSGEGNQKRILTEH